MREAANHDPRDDEFDDDPYAGKEFDEDIDDWDEWDGDADVDEADPGDMDGDATSALASAGFGTDEDYGDYGDTPLGEVYGDGFDEY